MVGTAQKRLCPPYDSAISSPARATSCRVVTVPPVNISYNKEISRERSPQSRTRPAFCLV
jgi:hypothetical protein